MLPTIDTTNPGVGSVTPQPRPEAERVAEVYRTSRAEERPEARKGARIDDRGDSYQASRAKTEAVGASADQVEINFQLTMEERDAFLAAFSSKQDPATMSPEEKETLQKASERISKYIEEAISRNRDNRERVEKAVGEWYSRMSRGERDGPADLVQLLRQAAMGNLDDMVR